jgi:hypothetical protein
MAGSMHRLPCAQLRVLRLCVYVYVSVYVCVVSHTAFLFTFRRCSALIVLAH